MYVTELLGLLLKTTPLTDTDTDVALDDDQDMVVVSPRIIEDGLTEMLAVGAGACQVTVTESVAVPPGPVAAMRKVSLPALLRLTDVLPLDAVLITDPSRVTDTEVALDDDHVIVTDCPAVGLVLLAEILATTLL